MTINSLSFIVALLSNNTLLQSFRFHIDQNQIKVVEKRIMQQAK